MFSTIHGKRITVNGYKPALAKVISLIITLLLFSCRASIPEGAVKYGIYYKKEYKDGRKFYWYENGQIATQEYYKNGKKHGKFTMHHKNGKIKAIQSYANGRLDGSIKSWNTKGVLVFDAFYKHGRTVGQSKHYFHDGKPQTITNSNKNGQWHGKTTWWYPSKAGHGIKAIYHYQNGKLDGKQTGYDHKGNIIYQSEFKNGTGKHCYLFDTGFIWLCYTYNQGIKHGRAEKFSPNGKLLSTRIYKKGKLIKETGEWR